MALPIRFSFVCVFLVLCPAFLVSAEKQVFSLTITAPAFTIKVGTDLHLRATVTNTSDRTIGFIRSPGTEPEEGFRYEIDVQDAQGQPAPPSAYVRDLQNKKTVTFESRVARWLKPGESFVDEIDVTRLYDLSHPGKYTISIAREVPPAQNLGSSKVRSNSIVVTVVR